ncbi:MAG: histidine kinase [Bacteroidetes bacterium]|nr:histidine kinase [Bacteroidota bacterium]
MKIRYIKTITLIALILVIGLQITWLHNTYSIFNKDFNNKTDKIFQEAISKVIYAEASRPHRKIPARIIVEGVGPDKEAYTNAMAFNEFYSRWGYPFSLSRMDSIFKKELYDNIGKLDYQLMYQNIKGKRIIKTGNFNPNVLNQGIHLERPLRKDKAEKIELYVSSPYRIIFGRMFLLFIASVLITLIVIYSLYWQMKIIARQDRIAEIRKDFTHAMIHDMKNPIMTIQMGINALKGGKLDDKLQMKQQYFEIVSKESEHLLSLTNKVLTIAKFEEKRMTLAKQTIELRPILDGIIDKYGVNQEKLIEFELDLEKLPSIYADAEYIYEAFSNLIDNAVKYSGKNVHIRISGIPSAHGESVIKIRDNGVGISLKDQKRIFEKFERVGSNKRNPAVRGFGLGLNYVYQVVTAHGGQVTVESVLNEYSEFTITLPGKENDQTTID